MNYFDKDTKRYFTSRDDKIGMVWINEKLKVYRIFDRVNKALYQGIDKCGVNYTAKEKKFHSFNSIVNNLKNYKRVFADISQEDKGYDISKDLFIKALNCKLSYKKLKTITQREDAVEKYDYYDFGIMKQGFDKLFSKQISIKYFTSWVMLWFVLQYAPTKNKRLQNIYEQIADYMDGQSFANKDTIYDYDMTSGHCYALLKNWQHDILDAKKNKTSPFDNNGILYYVASDHFDYDKDFYRYQILIVDTKRKQFNYFYIDNPTFDKNVNYDLLIYYEDIFAIDEEQEEEKYCIYAQEKIKKLLQKYKENSDYTINPKINFNYVK